MQALHIVMHVIITLYCVALLLVQALQSVVRPVGARCARLLAQCCSRATYRPMRTSAIDQSIPRRIQHGAWRCMQRTLSRTQGAVDTFTGVCQTVSRGTAHPLELAPELVAPAGANACDQPFTNRVQCPAYAAPELQAHLPSYPCRP